MKSQIVILSISEEYGYRNWYAILNTELYAQLKKDWQTIKGLNSLVPVQFLIPQARPLWILKYTPEHARYLNMGGLYGSLALIEGAHIHQADDSSLGDVKYDIPEQETFEFRGKAYTEKELLDLHAFYSDQEHWLYQRYIDAYPEDDTPVTYPEIWHQYSRNVPRMEITNIFVWPEDQPLPAGFTRDPSGKIIKEGADD